jgi:hypothetical protein
MIVTLSDSAAWKDILIRLLGSPAG